MKEHEETYQLSLERLRVFLEEGYTRGYLAGLSKEPAMSKAFAAEVTARLDDEARGSYIADGRSVK